MSIEYQMLYHGEGPILIWDKEKEEFVELKDGEMIPWQQN